MSIRSNLHLAITLLAVVGLLPLVASDAAAAPKSKQIETEAEFVSFDADSKTITVKVKKPGKRVKGLPKLKKGKEAVFEVKAEGSATHLWLGNGRYHGRGGGMIAAPQYAHQHQANEQNNVIGRQTDY